MNVRTTNTKYNFSLQDIESGFPTAEARKVGLRLGFPETQVDALISDLDQNGDGLLDMHELPRKSSVAAFLLFNFLAAPMMLLIVSVSLGALLATFEGWTFLDGFYFVGCNISGQKIKWYYILDSYVRASLF